MTPNFSDPNLANLAALRGGFGSYPPRALQPLPAPPGTAAPISPIAHPIGPYPVHPIVGAPFPPSGGPVAGPIPGPIGPYPVNPIGAAPIGTPEPRLPIPGQPGPGQPPSFGSDPAQAFGGAAPPMPGGIPGGLQNLQALLAMYRGGGGF